MFRISHSTIPLVCPFHHAAVRAGSLQSYSARRATHAPLEQENRHGSDSSVSFTNDTLREKIASLRSDIRLMICDILRFTELSHSSSSPNESGSLSANTASRRAFASSQLPNSLSYPFRARSLPSHAAE